MRPRLKARSMRGVAIAGAFAMALPMLLAGPAQAVTQPSEPLGVTLTAGKSTGQMTVTWSTPATTGGSPITLYKVQVAADGGSYGAPLSYGSRVRKATIICTGTSSCTARVMATNASGDSVPSLSATATWAAPSISKVTSVVAGRGPGTMTVKWSKPTNNGGKAISAYVYEVQTDGTGPWDGPYTIAGSGPTTGSAVLPCLSALPTGGCRYRVRAVNAVGMAAAGTERSGAWTVPGTPGIARVAPGRAADTAEVDWTAPANTGGLAISSYSYDVSVDGGAFTAGGTLPTSPTEAQLPCVGATFTCSYRVRATNARGSSATSAAESSVFTKPSPPSAITVTVTDANPAGGSADLQATWGLPANMGGLPVADYELQLCTGYCPDGDAKWDTAPITSLGVVSSWSGTCIAAELTCYVRMRATNLYGTSVWSAPRYVAPFAPTSLTATQIPAQGNVQLDWTAPTERGAGVASYQVWRCTTSSGCATNAVWTNTAITVAGTATTVNAPCTQNTTCTFRIRAVESGSGNVSPWSNTASAFAPDLSTAPQNPSAVTGDTMGSVVVDWDAPTDSGGYPITAYTIQRSTDGGTTWPTTIGTGSATPGPYTDTACGASVICTYRIAAVTAVGTGTWSTLVTAEGANTPSQPPSLTAVSGTTLGAVNLAWTTPTDDGGRTITGYTVERSLDGGTTWPGSFSPGLVLSYTDTTCGASVTCTYRVRAVNFIGTGAASANATADGADVPNAPTSLTATTATATNLANLGKVDLSWTAPSDDGGQPVTGYEFRVSRNGGAFSTWAPTGAGTATSFQHLCDAANLTAPDDVCTYEVRGVSVIGNGAASNQATAAGLVDHVAPTVTLTTPTDASFTTNTQPTISGTAGTAFGDATTLTVIIKQGATPIQTIPGVAIVSGAWSVTPSPLVQGSYTVVAEQSDWGGNVGSSNTNTFDVDGTPPTLTITAPTAGNNLDGTLTTTFTGTSTDTTPPATSITVRVYTASSSCSGANTALSASGTSWSVNDSTTRGENLTLSVRAEQTDAAGNFGQSACVAFATRSGFWVNRSTGNDANAGTKAAPKATIQSALDAANSDGGPRKRVFIAADTAFSSTTSLTLRANVTSYGGFAASGSTWTRPGVALVSGSVNAAATVFTNTTTTGDPSGAVANGVTGVAVDGMKIVGANGNTTTDRNTYGLRAVASANVTLTNVQVATGSAATGAVGADASGNAGNGSTGGDGQGPAGNGNTNRTGGGAGTGISGRNGGAGGTGGAQGNNAGGAGGTGIVVGGGGGTGGGGGNGSSDTFCDVDAGAGGGGNGGAGGTANAGGSAGSATLSGGTDTFGSGTAPTAGSAGNAGHGGGGGGGGGGEANTFCTNDHGAGGGGGGGAGGGGNGGGAGGNGGSSFGIYARNATVTMDSASSATASSGGAGGRGGNGSTGGTGAQGGLGGQCDGGQEGGGGGSGGSGGGGAGGSGGGGGAGGHSVAAYHVGTGTLVVGGTTTKGSAGAGASGGTAGTGGTSPSGRASSGKTNGTGCNQGGAGNAGSAGALGNAGSSGSAGSAFRIYDNGTTTS